MYLRDEFANLYSGMKAIRIKELENKVFFVAHKLWKVKDVIQGAMRQLQKAGVLTDVAVLYHHHRAACGQANGIFFVTPAGKEGHVQYVIEAGMTSSLRGISNYYTDPQSSKLGGHLGYHRVDFILDPTLEKKEYMGGRWKNIMLKDNSNKVNNRNTNRNTNKNKK